MEVDDGSHTSFVLMDKGQIFMGRTEMIVGDQEYYSIPWSGIGINLKPDHPYALPILKCTDSCYRYDYSLISRHTQLNFEFLAGIQIQISTPIQRLWDVTSRL